jgi:hypothetical protein
VPEVYESPLDIPWDEFLRCIATAARAGDKAAVFELRLLVREGDTVIGRVACSPTLVAAGLIPPRRTQPLGA